MRRKGERRLIDVIVDVERRREFRRQIEDRRTRNHRVEDERRAKEIEDLQLQNPEQNIPLDPNA